MTLVPDGHKRAGGARLAGIDQQTLCDWVHRYDAAGMARLADRYGGSPKLRLSAEREAEGWA